MSGLGGILGGKSVKVPKIKYKSKKQLDAEAKAQLLEQQRLSSAGKIKREVGENVADTDLIDTEGSRRESGAAKGARSLRIKLG